MAKKIYVAIYENTPKQFETWGECKTFVENKKNIIYKGFTDKIEAQNFINKNIKKEQPLNLKDVLYVYVDGSCNRNKEGYMIYGYGVCAVKNSEIVDVFSGATNSTVSNESHQIGGELFAALEGIRYAISQNEKRVIIVYDYMGIEMWANGSWAPKKEFVKEYVSEMQELMNKINVDFVHINSHINDGSIGSIFNNRADELAKKAVYDFNNN